MGERLSALLFFIENSKIIKCSSLAHFVKECVFKMREVVYN